MNSIDIWYCAFLFLFVDFGECLRCRSGNQQNDDNVHKVMQKCRKRHYSSDGKSSKDYAMSIQDGSSEENSESAGSSDEELFFSNTNGGTRTNNSRNGGNYGKSSNDNYGENRGNDRRQQTSYGNRGGSPNSRDYSSTNDRNVGSSNANDRWNYRNGMQTQNNRDNNNDDRRNRSECMSQCFFDELNLTDNRGFPERGSVMEIMTRGIQDPYLRDFIEESISECFRRLGSNTNNRDKCSFSSQLMSCFTDKAKERCEDWDD